MSLIFDDWNKCTDDQTGETYFLNWDDLESVPHSKILGVYCEAIRQALLERWDAFSDDLPGSTTASINYSTTSVFNSGSLAYLFFNWLSALNLSAFGAMPSLSCATIESQRHSSGHPVNSCNRNSILYSRVIYTATFRYPFGELYKEAGIYRKQAGQYDNHPYWQNDYSTKCIWFGIDQSTGVYSPYCGDIGDTENSIAMSVGGIIGGCGAISSYALGRTLLFCDPFRALSSSYDENGGLITINPRYSSLAIADCLAYWYDVLRYTNSVFFGTSLATIKAQYRRRIDYENGSESTLTETIVNGYDTPLTTARRFFERCDQRETGPFEVTDYARQYNLRVLKTGFYQKASAGGTYYDFGLNRQSTYISSLMDYTGLSGFVYGAPDVTFPLPPSYTSVPNTIDGFRNNGGLFAYHDLRDANGRNGGFNFTSNDIKYT